MSPKSIVLLVAGVIIISTLFSVFQVTYPTGNPITEHKVPKQFQLYQNQFMDKNLLGNSTTSFTPTGKGLVTIEGYVYNGSDNRAITNTNLYSAVFPAEATNMTSSTGFYHINVIRLGHGTFAFQAPGYNSHLYKLTLVGTGTYWLNITLHPAQKYKVSGTVVSGSQHPVSHAALFFTDVLSNMSVTASSSGKYSLSLYNGTYLIASTTPGYAAQPTPLMITVSGSSVSGFTITLKQLSTPVYYVSGYVHNRKGQDVGNASVVSNMVAHGVNTTSSGFYKIKVPVGVNDIIASGTGYYSNITIVNVQGNLTDVNLTLTNHNPFGSPGSGSISGSGLSGIPPGSRGGISGSIGNGTSTVNYGNNTTSGSQGSIMLKGQVNDTNNSAPVADTYLYFYINVNGTYFYSGVKTNSTGFYTLALSYTGHYKFYVYSKLFQNYTFTKWVNGTGYHNFTLTPLPGKTFSVSGIVKNRADNTGLPANVTVFAKGSTAPIMTRNTAKNGDYALYLIKGNYSMKATSFGFEASWNNTSTQPLSSNAMVNFSLNPASAIGPGSGIWSGGSTGLPGTSGSNISGQLNGSSGGSSLANGSTPVSVSVRLVNARNGTSLSGMKFEMFMKFNSVFYRHNGTTNSTGFASIQLAYEGNYTLLPESFYYYGSNTSASIKGNSTITLLMQPRQVYNASLLLINSYNYSRNSGNMSVPYTSLNITNYTQNSYTHEYSMNYGKGTMFNYTLPVGSYSFTYTNSNYVSSSFAVKLTSNYTGSHLIKPYLVIVNSTSNATYNYVVSGLAGSITVAPGANNDIYRSAAGNVPYTLTAYIGGDQFYSTGITLTPTTPVSISYINITSGVVSQSPAYEPTIAPRGNTLSVAYNYTGTVNGYGYVLYANYTIPGNSTLAVNGVNQSRSIQADNISLAPYYAISRGSPMDMVITSHYSSYAKALNAAGQAYNSVMKIYYYTPAENTIFNSGGT